MGSAYDHIAADINPKSWLSEYRTRSIEHLVAMGFFYYFLGLLIAVSIGVLQYSIYGYDEQYPPRSLVFALEAAPFEETIFFGIPFYATGNQFVLLGSGNLWTIFHLGNTQPQAISTTSNFIQ